MDVGIEMEKGTYIRYNDKHGNPIHIGDTLSFDAQEWGSENVFVLEFNWADFGLNIGFPIHDLTTYCEIIKKWDE